MHGRKPVKTECFYEQRHRTVGLPVLLQFRGIACKALDRAGIVTSGARGAHVFRHSAATNLLRSGATLETVGCLLRHRSPQTTAIYAKVDLAMLEKVAQPWIEGGAACR